MYLLIPYCSLRYHITHNLGFPGGSVVKNSPAMQEIWFLSLYWEDSLEKGNGNPLQYSCLGNPMDRGAWQATVRGMAKEWDPI